ncbi:MAG TPA: rRNA maturation RNase YbeY [Marinobacterium sp.]|nr:rRNA maturation RNase YbeY [Marinobacterium sp.]
MSLTIDVMRDVANDSLPSDQQLQHWAELAAADRQPGAELCIRIVTSEESQQLNRDYRGKDKPTNVLSFPFEAPPGLPINILGDLAICADVVAKEALEQNKQLAHHWAHMVIHGTLHLLGFDHINDQDAEIMEAMERELLARLDIPDPYAE